MSLRELGDSTFRVARRTLPISTRTNVSKVLPRYASISANASPPSSSYDVRELEQSAAFDSSAVTDTPFDPVSQAAQRKEQLPPSR